MRGNQWRARQGPPFFLYNPLSKQVAWKRHVAKAPEEPPQEFKIWKSNPLPSGDPHHGAEPSLRGWLWHDQSNRQEDNGGDVAQNAEERQ